MKGKYNIRTAGLLAIIIEIGLFILSIALEWPMALRIIFFILAFYRVFWVIFVVTLCTIKSIIDCGLKDGIDTLITSPKWAGKAVIEALFLDDDSQQLKNFSNAKTSIKSFINGEL